MRGKKNPANERVLTKINIGMNELRSHSKGRRNSRNSAADLYRLVAGSRRYIDADELTWMLFWRLTNHVK